jgi:DnaJ-class molecular chaperone
MSDPKDYYKILGLQKTATQEEIKNSYLNFINNHNPSSSTNIDERYKNRALLYKVTKAYNVLSDPELRADYDQDIEEMDILTLRTGFDTMVDNMHRHFNDMYHNFHNSFLHERNRFNEMLRERESELNSNSHHNNHNQHYESKHYTEETRIIDGKKNTIIREVNNANGHVTEKVTRIGGDGNKTENSRILENKKEHKSLVK